MQDQSVMTLAQETTALHIRCFWNIVVANMFTPRLMLFLATDSDSPSLTTSPLPHMHGHELD